MNWTAPVDIYCERLGPGLWAEPLNAISNLAFIFAAFWAWQTMRRLNVTNKAAHILTLLAFLIGIGSGLFHTFATTWSGLTDTIPIWAFVAFYLLTCVHILGGVAPGRIVIILVAVLAILTVIFLTIDPAADSPQSVAGAGILNGSEQYAPALIAMLVVSAITLKRKHPLRFWFTSATAIFVVSLTFRTLDMHLCPAWPQGTHFMWHILNGTMIAFLLQALIRYLANALPA